MKTIDDVKLMIIQRTGLQVAVSELSDDEPLFDEEGFALDSIDVFELSNGLEIEFNVPVENYDKQLPEILSIPRKTFDFLKNGDFLG